MAASTASTCFRETALQTKIVSATDEALCSSGSMFGARDEDALLFPSCPRMRREARHCMNAQHLKSHLKIRARLAERTELGSFSCNDAVRRAEAIVLAAILSIGICRPARYQVGCQ